MELSTASRGEDKLAVYGKDHKWGSEGVPSKLHDWAVLERDLSGPAGSLDDRLLSFPEPGHTAKLLPYS